MKTNPRRFATIICCALLAAPVYAQPAAPNGGNGAGQGGSEDGSSLTLPAATELLARTQGELATRRSVVARIRQQVQLFDQKLMGDGLYLQLAQEEQPLIRLELRFELGDQVSSLLQVNDGRQLWHEQQMGDQQQVQRVEIEQLRELWAKAGNVPAASPGGALVLGGLRGFLLGLDASFDFRVTGKAEFAGLQVYVLKGTWRPAALLPLLSEEKETLSAGALPALDKLPPQVPHEVLLLLGREVPFPYLVDFRRRVPLGGAGEGGEQEVRSIMKLQIYEVQLDGPVDPREFVYKPGDVPVSDATRQYYQALLGRARRIRSRE